MTTGQLIQRARKKAGLTQSELAEKIGASVVTIGQYERNKRQPRIEQLCLIAKALGVPVASLLPGDPIDIGFLGLKGHKIDGKLYLTEESLEAIKSLPKLTPEDWEKRKKEAEEIEALMAEYEAENVREGLRGAGPFQKMTDAEMYRAGFLTFKADDDRIAYFYSLLNIDGKLAASKYFFQHLDKDAMGTVADYVQHLSEIPQYQRHDTKQSPPEGTDTTPPGETPSEGG